MSNNSENAKESGPVVKKEPTDNGAWDDNPSYPEAGGGGNQDTDMTGTRENPLELGDSEDDSEDDQANKKNVPGAPIEVKKEEQSDSAGSGSEKSPGTTIIKLKKEGQPDSAGPGSKKPPGALLEEVEGENSFETDDPEDVFSVSGTQAKNDPQNVMNRIDGHVGRYCVIRHGVPRAAIFKLVPSSEIFGDTPKKTKRDPQYGQMSSSLGPQHTKNDIVALQGVTWVSTHYDPEELDPRTRAKRICVYVKVKWQAGTDPNNPKIQPKSWESGSKFEQIWGNRKAARQIVYEVAKKNRERYDEDEENRKERGESQQPRSSKSASPTPGVYEAITYKTRGPTPEEPAAQLEALRKQVEQLQPLLAMLLGSANSGGNGTNIPALQMLSQLVPPPKSKQILN